MVQVLYMPSYIIYAVCDPACMKVSRTSDEQVMDTAKTTALGTGAERSEQSAARF